MTEKFNNIDKEIIESGEMLFPWKRFPIELVGYSRGNENLKERPRVCGKVDSFMTISYFDVRGTRGCTKAILEDPDDLDSRTIDIELEPNKCMILFHNEENDIVVLVTQDEVDFWLMECFIAFGQ